MPTMASSAKSTSSALKKLPLEFRMPLSSYLKTAMLVYGQELFHRGLGHLSHDTGQQLQLAFDFLDK
ncbi:hypothetical protein BpHYR1_022132 [Brachionus plicatilis]|uniref:Uncharacterized protein n=1 Tax=Brachionus plicatilis TaxID=10195 RepID=A0A3M7SEM5_BRAPC|nr:hypothetical protein BpHYR1_022132 [Brachionus plicatilis]